MNLSIRPAIASALSLAFATVATAGPQAPGQSDFYGAVRAQVAAGKDGPVYPRERA